MRDEFFMEKAIELSKAAVALSASSIGNTFEGRELSRKRVEIFRQGIREITQELT